MNPRSAFLSPITGARDVYKVFGHLDFDIVFLTDYQRIKDLDKILDAFSVRKLQLPTAGKTYFIDT